MGSNPTLSAILLRLLGLALFLVAGLWACTSIYLPIQDQMNAPPAPAPKPAESKPLAEVLAGARTSFFEVKSPVSGGEPIRLGLGRETDQVVLGTLAALALQDRGYPVKVFHDLEPESLRAALAAGQLDLYWEYTGRALTLFLANPDRAVLRSADRCYQAVKATDAQNGLLWGRMSPANNTYGLLMPAGQAQAYEVDTVGDLADLTRPLPGRNRPPASLTLVMDKDFAERPDGLKALASLYELDLETIKLVAVDPDKLFQELMRARKPAAAVGPRIDARTTLFLLKVLDEEMNFFPAYNPAPLWRKDKATTLPQAVEVLNTLSAALDDRDLNDLIYALDVLNEPADQTARDWLAKNRLLKSARP